MLTLKKLQKSLLQKLLNHESLTRGLFCYAGRV